MRFLKIYKAEIVTTLVFLVLYFFTRLLFLTKLPIFTDEAIYIRWAQIALHDASWRFISLTDGKQPLQTWLMMGFLKCIQDPLLAGRLVSVSSGFFSMIGIWFLSYALFKNRVISFISSLLYIFYPLALLHDRLAIEDSLAAMWYIWSLYFSVVLIRRQKLVHAYTLGFVLGGGVLTKSIGFISMALLPLLFLLFDFLQKDSVKKAIKIVGLGCIAVGIGFGMYTVLRLSPLFGVIEQKNAIFIYPLHQWLAQSNQLKYLHFLGNFTGLIQGLVQYINIGYGAMFLVGVWGKKFWREKLLLFSFFLIPFLFDAVFGKIIFDRYFLFMSLMLLPICAYGIVRTSIFLQKHLARYTSAVLPVVTILAVVPSAIVSYTFLVDPIHSLIPYSDKSQYVINWPAGWGVTKAISYFKKESQNQHIFVGTQGTFGLMPFAFEMYFYNDPNVTTKAYWPINTTLPSDLLAKAKIMPTYIYFYEPCSNCPSTGIAPSNWPLTPVFTITPEGTMVHATLYKVMSR